MAILKEKSILMEELMTNHPKTAADIPVTRDELEMWQEGIQEAQLELNGTLEKMIEALDNGATLDPKQFVEAEEQIKELEVQANM
jgi:hypothetical protein